MRVAHLTDLHFLDTSPISWKQLIGKRGLGYINLYHRGRAKDFSDAARKALIRRVVQEKPDLVIISGDLTSTSRESEYRLAREGLKEILDNFPTFVIPGNHDYYDTDAVSGNHMVRYFGPWMNLTLEEYKSVDLYNPPPWILDTLRARESAKKSPHSLFDVDNAPTSPPESESPSKFSPEKQPQDLKDLQKTQLFPPFQRLPCLALEDVVVIGLDPTEPHLIRSTGTYKAAELEDLSNFLNPVKELYGSDPRGRAYAENTHPSLSSPYHNPLLDKFVILATHYPLLDRSGRDYQAVHWNHGVTNNKTLLHVLDTAQVKPNLVVHGHDHLGFTTPFFARPNALFSKPFDEQLVQQKDELERAQIEEELKTHPELTLSEFKKYGQRGKYAKLDLFDRNRFSVLGCPYKEREMSYRKMNFASPHTRTYTNRGRERKFYEYAVPFSICNPGSAGLAFANPKSRKDWARRASFVIYNISKRQTKEDESDGDNVHPSRPSKSHLPREEKEGLNRGWGEAEGEEVEKDVGGAGHSAIESNVMAEHYTKHVNKNVFLYEGKSNFDLRIQRFECLSNNVVREIPEEKLFEEILYDYSDLVRKSAKATVSMEDYYFPRFSGWSETLVQAFEKLPAPARSALDRVIFAIYRLKQFF